MWMNLIQSTESSEKSKISWRRKISASRLYHRNSAWVSSLLACATGFKLASPHNHMSQFLKINSSIFPSLFLSLSPPPYIYIWLAIISYGKNPDELFGQPKIYASYSFCFSEGPCLRYQHWYRLTWIVHNSLKEKWSRPLCSEMLNV